MGFKKKKHSQAWKNREMRTSCTPAPTFCAHTVPDADMEPRAPLHASGLVWCVEIRGGLLRINYPCACVVCWYQCCLLKFKIIFDFQMLYQSKLQLRLHHQLQDADFLRAAFKNAAQQSALPSPCRGGRETATLYGRVADASRLQDSQLVAGANRHERPRATAADSPVCAWGVCGLFQSSRNHQRPSAHLWKHHVDSGCPPTMCHQEQREIAVAGINQ